MEDEVPQIIETPVEDSKQILDREDEIEKDNHFREQEELLDTRDTAGIDPGLTQSALLQSIIQAKDSRKLANLGRDAVGRPSHTLGGLLSVGALARLSGHPYLSAALNEQAEIVASTSLSKDMALTSLAVTSKKETTRKLDSGTHTNADIQKKKSAFARMFGKSEQTAPANPNPPQYPN